MRRRKMMMMVIPKPIITRILLQFLKWKAKPELNGKKHNLDLKLVSESKESSPNVLESQLFLGFNYYTVGFDSREFDLLSKAIENYLGEISNDPNDDSITHVVIPAGVSINAGFESLAC